MVTTPTSSLVAHGLGSPYIPLRMMLLLCGISFHNDMLSTLRGTEHGSTFLPISRGL